MSDVKHRGVERSEGAECRLSAVISVAEGLLLQEDDLRFRPLDSALLSPGELYLFRFEGAPSPLWGVFAHDLMGGGLMLETATNDLQLFSHWHPLASGAVSFRSATRDELRDYFYNLARQEEGK